MKFNIDVTTPTIEALELSIRNNIFFYYVMLFAWVGFLLYAQAYHDTWLFADSFIFFVAACTFYVNQKVDKCRLELQRALKDN